jgi:hypothetical protein
MTVGLAGCASPPLLPPDARAVHAFDLVTQLGRRFSIYAASDAACRELRATPPREAFPLTRASIVSDCYPAALRTPGTGWGVDIDGDRGAVIDRPALCDELREYFVRRFPGATVTACVPAAVVPARHS